MNYKIGSYEQSALASTAIRRSALALSMSSTSVLFTWSAGINKKISLKRAIVTCWDVVAFLDIKNRCGVSTTSFADLMEARNERQCTCLITFLRTICLFCFVSLCDWFICFFTHSNQSQEDVFINLPDVAFNCLFVSLAFHFSVRQCTMYVSNYLTSRPDVESVCLLHLFAWLFIHFIERRCTWQITFLADQILRTRARHPAAKSKGISQLEREEAITLKIQRNAFDYVQEIQLSWS